MKHLSLDLRREFAKPGCCELCGKPCQEREGHHVWHKGSGGGGVLDFRINLISVGGSNPFPACPCHDWCEAERIPRMQVIEKISAREHCIPEDLVSVMDLFRRLIKPTKLQLLSALGELGDKAKKLAMRELGEAKLL